MPSQSKSLRSRSPCESRPASRYLRAVAPPPVIMKKETHRLIWPRTNIRKLLRKETSIASGTMRLPPTETTIYSRFFARVKRLMQGLTVFISYADGGGVQLAEPEKCFGVVSTA